MTLPATVTLSPEVMARQVGDESVLLDLASGNYFGLDAVGARFWQLLSDALSPTEACDRLEAEYDVSRETLERDVAHLLENLRAQGLVSWD